MVRYIRIRQRINTQATVILYGIYHFTNCSIQKLAPAPRQSPTWSQYNNKNNNKKNNKAYPTQGKTPTSN